MARSPNLRFSQHAGALCVLMAFLPLFAPTAMACRYSVREVAFVELDTGPLTLYYFPAEPDDAAPTALAEAFRNSGLHIETVAEPNHPAQAYKASTPLPAAALVAEDGRALPVNAPNAAALLTAVLHSRAQKELLEALPEHLCVALLVHGADADATARLRAQLSEAMARLERRLPTLERPTREGVRLIEVSPGQLASERVLLWSLGLDPDFTQTKPSFAAVFGHGRRFGPLYSDGELSTDEMTELFALAGASCECGLERSWMQGPIVPLDWSREAKARVAAALGFDPENPLVALEMRQILAQAGSAGSQADDSPGAIPSTGYREMTLTDMLDVSPPPGAQNAPAADASAPPRHVAARQAVPLEAPQPGASRRGMAVVVGLVVAINAVLLAVLQRRRAHRRET